MSETVFPAAMRVSIPADIVVEGSRHLVVRIRPDCCDVARLDGEMEGRIYAWEMDASLCDEPGLLRRLEGKRVRLRVDRSNLDAIGRHMVALRGMRVVIQVETGPEMVRLLNHVTSEAFPAHIVAAADGRDGDAIRGAADLFLHGPLLEVPIEPFASLLRAAHGGLDLSLWDTEMERTGTDAFVSDGREVGLSARWIRASRFYGRWGDTWDRLQDSPAHELMADRDARLFREQSACTTCEHFDICRGFLRALDDTAECDPWQGVFSSLKSEARRASELMRGFDGQVAD